MLIENHLYNFHIHIREFLRKINLKYTILLSKERKVSILYNWKNKINIYLDT